jgi:hypothetical protein
LSFKALLENRSGDLLAAQYGLASEEMTTNSTALPTAAARRSVDGTDVHALRYRRMDLPRTPATYMIVVFAASWTALTTINPLGTNENGRKN